VIRCDYEMKHQDQGLLEAMICCLACSHDSSFVSRGNFECRNAREFWNRVAAGKAVREAGVV